MVGRLKRFGSFPQSISFVFNGFEKGPACVQIKTIRGSTFQTKRSEKCKGHAIYGIVTVYWAVTLYRAVTVYRA